jgi:pimeloyl-ACP methyl ester carboxylesterase
MRKILYIHGAFSSSLSFQRIREKLPKHEAITIDYTVDQKINEVIDSVNALLSHEEGPIDIVAHSLGGIVGTSVAKQSEKIRSIVTLSTPFGGSKVADLLRWISSHELYKSLCPTTLLQELQAGPLRCKHRCVITTVGNNPMMYEPNDGVVTLKSQMAAIHAEQIQVPINHFEILLSDTTVKLIKEFTFK